MFELTERVQALAAAAVARAAQHPGCGRTERQTAAYFGHLAERPLRERQARSLAEALVAEPVRIFPGERLHGMFYYGQDPQWHSAEWGEHSVGPSVQQRTREELCELLPYATQPAGGESYILDTSGSPGHIAWHYHLLLEGGVDGLLRTIAEHRGRAADDEARAFHDGATVLWEAVLEWNQRHVDELRRIGDEAGAALLEQVPAKPARTFLEAVQSFYFQWLAVMYEVPYGGNSPGRLDYYL